METDRASKERERVHLISSPLFYFSPSHCAQPHLSFAYSLRTSHIFCMNSFQRRFLDHTLHTKKRFSGETCCIIFPVEGEYPRVLLKHFHAPAYPVLYIYAFDVFIFP